MEKKYGAPALYIMGAAADQIPQKTVFYSVTNQTTGGSTLVAGTVEEGLVAAEEVAAEMTAAATNIIENEISMKSGQKLAITSDYFMWPAANRDGSAGDPIRFDVKVIQFGDLALVGVSPEVYASLGLAVKNNSPFATTMIVSCSDIIYNYLPDAQAYIDSVTTNVEGTTKSAYARGAGEQFVLKAIAMLDGLFGR
jgi:hypothetical protein